jgi:hypothetical protein
MLVSFTRIMGSSWFELVIAQAGYASNRLLVDPLRIAIERDKR